MLTLIGKRQKCPRIEIYPADSSGRENLEADQEGIRVTDIHPPRGQYADVAKGPESSPPAGRAKTQQQPKRRG
jgi:hypothetical protein